MQVNFKICLVYRLLSTQKWVSIFSSNSLKNTLVQRAWISIFSILSENEITETQFQRLFDFHGCLSEGILPKKKSGYIEWYLVFFCDIWTFFCQIKLRLEISQKKVQISKKKSRYHFLFWTSVPYFGIKRGYQKKRQEYHLLPQTFLVYFGIKRGYQTVDSHNSVILEKKISKLHHG